MTSFREKKCRINCTGEITLIFLHSSNQSDFGEREINNLITQ
jgi:hypothetical protein